MLLRDAGTWQSGLLSKCTADKKAAFVSAAMMSAWEPNKQMSAALVVTGKQLKK